MENGNNPIEYGPAKKIDVLDKTKQSMIQDIDSFDLKDLIKLQRSIGIVISGSDQAEGVEKERIIREGLIGHIKTVKQSDNWLESIETKIKIVKAEKK